MIFSAINPYPGSPLVYPTFISEIIDTPKTTLAVLKNPTIPSLFVRRSPSTIFGRVITRAVDSIQGVFIRGSFAHIFNEIFKRAKPPITNFDSSATIPAVPNSVWVVTTLFNRNPCIIPWCLLVLVDNLHDSSIPHKWETLKALLRELLGIK